MYMDMKYGVIAVAGICILVLLIGILKRKAEIFLNFMVRIVVGFIGVYFLNTLLARQGIDVAVGLNVFSALTLGTLGMGGFVLLYGIMFLQLL